MSVIKQASKQVCLGIKNLLGHWCITELHVVFPLQGTTFFDKLLEKLQQKYGFDVEDYMESSLASQENQSRHVKLAILSIQRLMINLGDIARYREQMNHSGKVNYGRARR